VGRNSRLDNLQAAILEVKLKFIEGWNRRRREIAGKYREGLTGLSGIRLLEERGESWAVYHLFVVYVEKRTDFIAYLNQRGIETGLHYPKAIHEQVAFAPLFRDQRFPHAEFAAEHGVSLPMCPTLTEEKIDRVIHAVRSYFG
jgi:dTDP-4-amino-4,6-dideoxygalactose transaminase